MVARLFAGLLGGSKTKAPAETYKNIFASTVEPTVPQKRSSSIVRKTAKKKSSATTIPPKKRGRPSKKHLKA